MQASRACISVTSRSNHPTNYRLRVCLLVKQALILYICTKPLRFIPMIFKKALCRVLFAAVFLVAATSAVSAACGGVKVENMRCEYSAEPIAIGSDEIRFTWSYTSSKDKPFEQGRVELLLADSPRALAKSEAVVITTNRPFVKRSTADLDSHSRYCWQVIVYDKRGKRVAKSDVAWFSTSYLHNEPWQAKWISDSYGRDYRPAPMFRKEFSSVKAPQRAYLYISAAGYYDAKINGRAVSEDWMNPGFTHYDKRNLYMVHDVTPLVASGENVISATLGNGFYNEYTGMTVWQYERARWRNRPRMICELHLFYEDGTHDVVCSDESWKSAVGEVQGNVIYAGDVVDARKRIEGWDSASFDDAAYALAQVVDSPSPMLVAQQMPPIRSSEDIRAERMKRLSDREYIFYFPENMAGVTTLDVEGEEGTRIEVLHGELLKADSTLEMGNIAIYSHPVGDAAFQTDRYTLSGKGRESFTARFHYNGFQYVSVKADRPIELDENSLTAHFIHSDVESVGEFDSSNKLFNKLWRSIRRGYLSNLHGIPTDCPHREKNGWTADAHVSIDIAFTNYDALLVYEKWVDDIIDNQRPDGSISGVIPGTDWGYADWIGAVWDAVIFEVPNAMYNYYGDERAIAKIFPMAERYLKYLAGRENDEGTVTYGLGDWCYYQTITPSEYVVTCYYYRDYVLMARFAELLGKDATAYKTKAEALRNLINRKYLNTETGEYSIGRTTAQALPLAFGIVPSEYELKVAEQLNRTVVADGYVCDFGLIGSKYALRMLVKYGYIDTAYRLATQTEIPSWGNWIKQGYTTPLETWIVRPDFRDSSANHVFFGDIAAWFQNDLVGINYDVSRPGFEHIVLRPHFPEGLDWARGSFRSVRGLVSSSWSRTDDKMQLEVVVPLNTTATLYIGDTKQELRGTGKPQTFTFPVPQYK